MFISPSFFVVFNCLLSLLYRLRVLLLGIGGRSPLVIGSWNWPCWGGGGGGVGGMHVPRLNFKSCHVAILEDPYVAVGISSTATPEVRRTSYVLLAAPKF